MIDPGDVLEARSRVAIFADVGGIDVRGVLAGGVDTVVARRAVAGYRTVIELGITPGVGVVAVVASIRTLYMRGGFSFGDGAVVARATGSQHGVVVDSRHVLECRGRMAILADVGGIDVRGVLARGINTVMARRTIAADIGVIEGCIGPRVCCVTIFTRVTGGQVVG